MKYPQIKQISGRLRKQSTPSEKVLWEILRKRRLNGYRFLRQHPLYYDQNEKEHFFFVPDFYSPELKLIIELDGFVHLYQKTKDQERDLILTSLGFKILRILNEELSDIEAIKKKILDFIQSECNKQTIQHPPPP